ncbi:hypothetical protein U2F10_24070 [Leptothoe sp. EHU-05/26/07-4]
MRSWSVVFAIAYFTGSRISEVLSLKISAIQSNRIIIIIVVEAAPELEGISTHSFRRSFATNLQKAGRTAAEIGRLLGGRLLGHRWDRGGVRGMTARCVG